MQVILFIYVRDQYYQILVEKNCRITIGASKRDTLTLADTGLEDGHIVFVSRNGTVALTAKKGIYQNGTEVSELLVNVGDVFSSEKIAIYVCPRQQDYERSVALSGNREYTIGRSKECSLCFSNKRVSSHHAKIVFESGKYKVIDLDSKNHTFVNGKRVSSCYLEDGDTITIAYYLILFLL